MTQLKTFANLWTLWDHPGRGGAEWSLPEKVAAIAGAGFDGVMGDPGVGIGKLASQNGLRFIAFARLDERHDFGEVLGRCRDEGATVVQVHLGWHDASAELSLELAQRLFAAAREQGIEAVLETHRDTCTETPEKTESLRRAFLETTGCELPLLLDFSHHAVVKHLDPPFAKRLLGDVELVRRTRWHHMRPFNGHHAQVPVLMPDGSLALEMADWLDFADEVICLLYTSLLSEVWVCPEIGPVRGGYGLSVFPPSWEQAVILRKMILERWGETLARGSEGRLDWNGLETG